MSIIHDALKKAEQEKPLPDKKETVLQHNAAFLDVVASIDKEQTQVIEQHKEKITEPVITEQKVKEKKNPFLFYGVLSILLLICAGSFYGVYRLNHTGVPADEDDLLLEEKSSVSRNGRAQEQSTLSKHFPSVIENNPLGSRLNKILSLNKTKFVCTGIVLDGIAPVAIVNGSVLEEGDTISGAVVGRIMPTEVILKKDGKRITVPLQI